MSSSLPKSEKSLEKNHVQAVNNANPSVQLWREEPELINLTSQRKSFAQRERERKENMIQKGVVKKREKQKRKVTAVFCHFYIFMSKTVVETHSLPISQTS